MRCDADTMPLAEVDKGIALEVGVQLDLVHSRPYLGVCQTFPCLEEAVVAGKGVERKRIITFTVSCDFKI